MINIHISMLICINFKDNNETYCLSNDKEDLQLIWIPLMLFELKILI